MAFLTSQSPQISHIVAIARGILNAANLHEHNYIRVEVTHANDLNFTYNRVGESYFVNHNSGEIEVTDALSKK